jgi:hypothetical protein
MKLLRKGHLFDVGGFDVISVSRDDAKVPVAVILIRFRLRDQLDDTRFHGIIEVCSFARTRCFTCGGIALPRPVTVFASLVRSWLLISLSPSLHFIIVWCVGTLLSMAHGRKDRKETKSSFLK